jgi:hypothetical protein
MAAAQWLLVLEKSPAVLKLRSNVLLKDQS